MKLCFKLLVIILFAVWFFGGMQYYKLINSYKTIDNVDSKAIVVLTGGSGRLSNGAKLLLKSKHSHLFITGVNSTTTKKDLSNFIDISNSKLNSSVTLGYEAVDTAGNAKETKQWILQNNIDSIALVTAHYHMPRSLIEFKNILKDIKITPVSVIPDLFKINGKYNKKIQVLFFEYNKFLLSSLRIYMMSY